MLSQITEEYLDMSDDEVTYPESSDSNDDDISIVMKSSDSKTQKKTFRKKTNHEEFITDFDKEMESELCDTVHALEFIRKLPGSEFIASTTSSQKNDSVLTSTREVQVHDSVGNSQPSSSGEKCQRYDDIYFDSDEEIEKKDSDNSFKQVLSNDELFYDPEMDRRDQMWMDERRLNPMLLHSSKKRKNKVKNTKKNNEVDSNNSLNDNMKRKKLQNSKNHRAHKSDTILDCPACMTTLCIDCQKHDIFPNQYRAMFVMNCTIDFTERFRYPQNAGQKKNHKVSLHGDKSSIVSLAEKKDDIYYSVKCNECRTQVAMYDRDEVYHFFNIISSYG